MWFIYIARASDNSLYTGVTTDINRREREHNNLKKGAKALYGKRPVKIIYTEKFKNRSKAQKREWIIKKLDKSEKEKIVLGYKGA